MIERSFPEHSLTPNEDFMRAKVTEIAGKAPALTSEEADDLLNAYLSINRDTRAENEATIAEICSASR